MTKASAKKLFRALVAEGQAEDTVYLKDVVSKYGLSTPSDDAALFTCIFACAELGPGWEIDLVGKQPGEDGFLWAEQLLLSRCPDGEGA